MKKTNGYCVTAGKAYVDVSTPKIANTSTIIDAADLPLVIDGNGRWFAQDVGGGRIYVCRHVPTGPYKSKIVYLHRHLFGADLVDHENLDSLDNRRSNLRPATKSQNAHNSTGHRDRASAFKGVRLRPDTGRWTARIFIGGRQKNLGCFASEQEAAAAYDRAARDSYGEYARPNSEDRI